ncbi:lipopolysaccharide biosynthesis protein [Fodinicola feengrottensis]|uniref:lipopolysaccharide biosynthesis protein n=1 Tax=Fodinicola feengrottensis TaxID=435914 RepID=UPI0013D0EDE7|nr:lipopolysaccharide biosynthesis protein [Fodinicola feengrottensis]
MSDTMAKPASGGPKKAESRKTKKARKTQEAKAAADALAARRNRPVRPPTPPPATPEPVEVEPIPQIKPGRAIVSSGLLTMLALVSIGLVRLVHGSLVNHHLANPAKYGTVTLLIAIATVTSLALPAGVASAMSKFIPYHRGSGAEPTARSVYRFLSRLGLAGSVFFGIAVGLLTPLFVPEVGVRDAILVGLLTFTFSTYSFDKSALYGFDRVASYTKLELSTGVLTILITIAILVTPWQGYLLPFVVGYGLFTLGARMLLRANMAGEVAPVSAFDRREVIAFVALACAGTLASTGFLYGTNILAKIFSTPAAVGYFGAAVTLVQPMNLLPRALNLALFPAMAHAQGAGDTDAVRRHTDISTRALFFVLARRSSRRRSWWPGRS